MTNTMFQFTNQEFKNACERLGVAYFIYDNAIFIAANESTTYKVVDNFKQDGAAVVSHLPAIIERIPHTFKQLMLYYEAEAYGDKFLCEVSPSPVEFFFAG